MEEYSLLTAPLRSWFSRIVHGQRCTMELIRTWWYTKVCLYIYVIKELVFKHPYLVSHILTYISVLGRPCLDGTKRTWISIVSITIISGNPSNIINSYHRFWYGITSSDGVKLEKFARSQYNDYFTKCSEYLRHKTIMLSPYLLKQRDPNI